MQDTSGNSALLRSALVQFAAVGFEGASLQRIAADAGLSKSSVLYHFGSKEALLDAALRPAVEDLAALLGAIDPAEHRAGFAARFVDYLYEHRLAISVLINHGKGLAGHAVIDDADRLVRALADRIEPDGASTDDSTRFGVALAGAAFMLVAADRWSMRHLPEEELRATLTRVLEELLLGGSAPLPA